MTDFKPFFYLINNSAGYWFLSASKIFIHLLNDYHTVTLLPALCVRAVRHHRLVYPPSASPARCILRICLCLYWVLKVISNLCFCLPFPHLFIAPHLGIINQSLAHFGVASCVNIEACPNYSLVQLVTEIFKYIRLSSVDIIGNLIWFFVGQDRVQAVIPP